jgi:hypothetical protein
VLTERTEVGGFFAAIESNHLYVASLLDDLGGVNAEMGLVQEPEKVPVAEPENNIDFAAGFVLNRFARGGVAMLISFSMLTLEVACANPRRSVVKEAYEASMSRLGRR